MTSVQDALGDFVQKLRDAQRERVKQPESSPPARAHPSHRSGPSLTPAFLCLSVPKPAETLAGFVVQCPDCPLSMVTNSSVPTSPPAKWPCTAVGRPVPDSKPCHGTLCIPCRPQRTGILALPRGRNTGQVTRRGYTHGLSGCSHRLLAPGLFQSHEGGPLLTGQVGVGSGEMDSPRVLPGAPCPLLAVHSVCCPGLSPCPRPTGCVPAAPNLDSPAPSSPFAPCPSPEVSSATHHGQFPIAQGSLTPAAC